MANLLNQSKFNEQWALMSYLLFVLDKLLVLYQKAKVPINWGVVKKTQYKETALDTVGGLFITPCCLYEYSN